LERGVTQNKINGFIGNSTHYPQAIITVQRCHIGILAKNTGKHHHHFVDINNMVTMPCPLR
jgi:hypothetical protein